MFYFACLIFAIFGSIIGSFSVAQVWRLRALELNDAKKNGEKIDMKEWSKLKNLVESKKNKDRSHCLNCGYQLKWFDLIPIFSWLSLGGKCRKCRKSIGWLEFLAEVSTAVVFVLVFVSLGFDFSKEITPVQAFRTFILFATLSSLVILFIYDAKWSLLPVRIMWIFNFLAFMFFALGVFEKGISFEIISNLTLSILAFPAVYLLLSVVSKGAWVGDGDWILALGLVLLLPNSPMFSLLLMMFSNVIGLVIILLNSIFEKKKLVRGAQIPFGPAMILACLILLIFQPIFIEIVDFLAV